VTRTLRVFHLKGKAPMALRIDKSGGLSRKTGIFEPTDDEILEDLAKKSIP
jgi:hypothetical protein